MHAPPVLPSWGLPEPQPGGDGLASAPAPFGGSQWPDAGRSERGPPGESAPYLGLLAAGGRRGGRLPVHAVLAGAARRDHRGGEGTARLPGTRRLALLSSAPRALPSRPGPALRLASRARGHLGGGGRRRRAPGGGQGWAGAGPGEGAGRPGRGARRGGSSPRATVGTRPNANRNPWMSQPGGTTGPNSLLPKGDSDLAELFIGQ